METEILQVIENLRYEFNQKLDIISRKVHENTQILKALEHPPRDNTFEPQDRELINFICQQATKNRYDPDSQ